MRRGLVVSVCRTCGQTLFPRRALCPACGGASWRLERAEDGVVEEATTVRHAVEATDAPAVVLASVRLDAGPVIVACLEGQAGTGGRVELVAVDGAPIARPREGDSSKSRVGRHRRGQ